MSLSFRNTTKTFSLLSIGHRGVGKTVFLAGSYAELHADNTDTQKQRKLWFDSQDAQIQENIDKIINFVAQTGQYPPPTMKITNFHFSLKRHGFWGTKTLCNFRWWEIPGEICKISNQDFIEIVSSSHGCCLFIDAHALIHDQAYIKGLGEFVQIVENLAYLVSLNNLKYAFAVIITKYDLLKSSEFSQQHLEKELKPIISLLEDWKANYQVFYSSIPIVQINGYSTLDAKGAAAPLLWLVWELSKAHAPGLMNNLLNLVTQVLPSIGQVQEEVDDGSIQKLFKPWKPNVNELPAGKKLFITYRNLFFITLASASLIGVAGILLLNSERLFQPEPTKLEALKSVATLQQKKQFGQAISLMEKLVQQDPKNIELRLQLAELYQSAGQDTMAETAYDAVLAQQSDNLKALIAKATLRVAKGDTQTAEALLERARTVAPTEELKAHVREVSKKTLQSPANQRVPAKQ